jgi:two-component system sensor histidine kinase/response regulator
VYYGLRSLMHETMKPLGITAAAKGLPLAYIVGEEVPDSIWGDPLRLRQIIVNLVGNAIKFTQSGEIGVRVSASRTDERHLQLRFEVRDTGVGIDPSQHETIFQPFAQAESTGASGGTGLGLAIVARLVEAMGGTIEVESTPGKGSAFHFSVATETDAFAAPLRRPWEALLAGKSMLVVDPHRFSRTFIAEMLRSRDVFATACATADEAPRGARYALTITSEPAAESDRFIVVASPLAAAHLEFLHVTRPVSERELFETIGIALGVSRPAVVVAPPRWSARGPHLRVLVVEDHPVNQEFAAEALRRLGHDVAIASNGFEAVARIERDHFDVVLMDVQMPGIDGMETTKRLRATDNGRRARVIAMTAFTRKEDRDRCLEAGMDAVLPKPVNVTELAAALQSIEPDRLLDTVGGNVRLLARVTAAFAQQTPPLMAAMHDAIRSADAQALYEAAHKLKGSVSNFETSATEFAQEIEDYAQRGELDRAAAVMPHLQRAVRELEQRLSAASNV